MKKAKIGFAMCASHCCFDRVLGVLEKLGRDYDIVPIMSERAAGTDTRFGRAEDFRSRLEEICGKRAVCDIVSAEPIGPKEKLDALVVAPCTGNTLAKLNHGITDSSVTMAAKAHLRNLKPLVLAFSTNDGLAATLPNVAGLIIRKNIYFVPFRQDDYEHKPTSLASDFELIGKTLEYALEGKQLRPVIFN